MNDAEKREKIKILVVDDEKLERDAISSIIEHSGLDAQIAGKSGNGEETLRLVRELSPDALIVDIKMPGINGIELMRRLHAEDAGLKFVIVSAYDVFDYAHEAIELGAVEYVLKPARRSEIERAVKKLIDIIKEEREKEAETSGLKEQLSRMLPYIKSSLMYDLINGSANATVFARAEFLGFPLLPCAVMEADIDSFAKQTGNMTEASRQLLKKKVFDAVESAFDSERAVITLPLFEDKIMVLASMTEKGEEAKHACIELADGIRRRVARETPLTCSVGIGGYCADVLEIPAAFEMAGRCIWIGKTFLGGNRTVHSDDVAQFSGVAEWYPYKEEKTLLNQFTLGSREDLDAAIEAYTDALRLHTEVPAVDMRRRLMEFLAVASRAVVDGGAAPEPFAQKETEVYAELMNAAGSDEVIGVIHGACRKYRDLLSEAYPAGGMELVKKAVAFLADNFEKDISLNDVAHSISLSPHYFSRLFKNVMDMNFIEYLTELRIEQAKKLLLQTGMSIGEVSAAVGYPDASYFSRVFSRVVGVPPRDFRQSRGSAARH